MKLPELTMPVTVLIVIICIAGVLGIGFGTGILTLPGNRPGNYSTSGEKLNDVSYEIQEWNFSYIHNRTIVSRSYDHLKDFPDLEQSMHGERVNTPWTGTGTHVTRFYEGNSSDYIRFR